MAALTALKLIAAKKAAVASPTQQRRNKLLKKIGEQLELARAQAEGRNYTQRRFKTIKGEDGSRRSVEIERGVRPWWWLQDNGKLALSVRYGSKVIALTSKANAIEVANFDELTAALATIKTAIDAGELDTQIEAASVKLREGFGK